MTCLLKDKPAEEQITIAYKKVKDEEARKQVLHRQRGLVCEDYVYHHMDISQLMTKYSALYHEIAKILLSYEENSPVNIRFEPKMTDTFYNLVTKTDNYFEFMNECEKAFIEHNIRNSENIKSAAISIGIQRSHLYTKMRKFNLHK